MPGGSRRLTASPRTVAMPDAPPIPHVDKRTSVSSGDHSPDGDSMITAEVGREFQTTCRHCGRLVWNTSGFVYRDRHAFAIYHTTLHLHAGVPRADVAIGIGEWATDASVADVSAF